MPPRLPACAKPLILVAIALLLTLPKHSGFIALLLVPLFVVSLIKGLIYMLRQSPGRNAQGLRILAWLAMFGVIASVHGYWYTASRRDADGAAAAILAYKTRTGAYPAALDGLGVDPAELKRKWMLRYAISGEHPSLYYASTFTIFDTYSFDFDSRNWSYRAD